MADSLAERYITQVLDAPQPFVAKDLCARMLRDVELSGRVSGVTKAMEELVKFLTPEGQEKAVAMLDELRFVTASMVELTKR